jgi:glycine betaine/choline ABC-type transport system substrate-binding protein
MTDSSREELEQQLAAADREKDDLRLQMDTVRQAVASEVESGWSSPFKSEDTLDAMVRARLAGRAEYQTLRARQRELDELRRSLTSQLDGLGGHTP